MKKSILFSTEEITNILSGAFSTNVSFKDTDYDSAPFLICGMPEEEGNAFIVANTGEKRRPNCFFENGAVLCNGFVIGLHIAKSLGYNNCSYGDVQLSKVYDMDYYVLAFLSQQL